MPQYVLCAESEIVYFYAMKKCKTVVGDCGTGHSRRPLAASLTEKIGVTINDKILEYG
jgi:hypothetical protein